MASHIERLWAKRLYLVSIPYVHALVPVYTSVLMQQCFPPAHTPKVGVSITTGSCFIRGVVLQQNFHATASTSYKSFNFFKKASLIYYVQFIVMLALYTKFMPSYTSHITTHSRLVKHSRGNLASNVRIRHKAANQSRLRAPVEKDDAGVVLQPDGQQVALLVDGELARELAAGGDDLQQLELAGDGVDLEVDEGVGGDRLRRVVKVGDGAAVFGTGRDDEVVCVGLMIR